MFEFLSMAGNYEARVVGRDDFDWGFISTAKVNDGRKPYETAVEHNKYNNGEMVIVECYDTKTEAKEAHTKWVKTMTAKKLPTKLIDCNNSKIQQLCTELGGNLDYEYQD